MKNIDTLAKKLTLYTSKSNSEIDRKINALDSKAKNEARKLQSENENLKEMIMFKDEKIQKMQEEIDRLKTVLRVQSDLAPDNISKPDNSMQILEKRIDEMAEKGKLEFKIVVPPGNAKEQEPEKELARILALPHTNLAKTVISQGKLLEDYVKEADLKISELKNQMSTKISELEIQRKDLENRIVELLQNEQTISIKYESLVKQYTSLIKDPKITEKLKSQIEKSEFRVIQNTGSNWIFPMEIIIPQINDIVENKGTIKSIQEAHDLISKLISEKRIREASDVWKELDYELSGLSEFDAANKLRIICQLKDMQIKELANAVPDTETAAKCIELPENEILDLVAYYEEAKAKSRIAESENANEYQKNIKELTSKIKDLENQLLEKDKIIKEQADKVILMGANMNMESKNEETIKINESNKIIEQQTAKIQELEQKLSECKKTDSLGQQTENYEPKITILSPKDHIIESKNTIQNVKETAVSPIRAFENENVPKNDTLMSENAKNRELIRELLNNDKKDMSKVNTILYNNNTELNDKLISINQEISKVKDFCNDLLEKQENAKKVISKLLKKEQHKVTGEKPKEINEILVKINTDFKEVYDGISEIAYSVEGQKMQINPNRQLLFTEAGASLNSNANKIYKDFFSEDKLTDASTETMLKQIKSKNESFKELFNICEKLFSTNQELSNQLHSVSQPKLISSPGTTRSIKDLSPEQISSRTALPVQMSTSVIENTKPLESKVAYLNAKLLECNKEIDKQEEIIKQRTKNIEIMELELSRREAENKRLLQTLGTSEHQLLEKTSEIANLQEKLTKTQAELSEYTNNKGKYGAEIEKLSNEKTDLLRKISEQSQELLTMSTNLKSNDTNLKIAHDRLKDIEQELEETKKQREIAEQKLHENLEEYKTSMDECHTQINDLAGRLSLKEDYMGQVEKVLDKLKELKENYVMITAVSSPVKSELFQNLNDDFSASLLLIDEVKDRLITNKKMIETLQSAVNALQGERQLMQKAKKSDFSYMSLPYYSPYNPDLQMSESAKRMPLYDASNTKLNDTVKKYQNWFNSTQDLFKEIVKFSDGAIQVDIYTENKSKLSLAEMKEILQKVPEILMKLKTDFSEQISQIESLKSAIQNIQNEHLAEKTAMDKGNIVTVSELERKVQSLQNELAESYKENDRIKKDRTKNENLLSKQREEYGKLYEKGIFNK